MSGPRVIWRTVGLRAISGWWCLERIEWHVGLDGAGSAGSRPAVSSRAKRAPGVRGNCCCKRRQCFDIAAGDPTATPLSAGCACPGCKFLTQGLCPAPQPECATRCVDDPDSFCLYCVGPDGQARLVGRYATAEAWVAAVQAQRTACGCGGGGGGNDVGECGTMYRMVTAEGSSTYPCCRDPKCDGTYRYMEFDCGVACNRTCTSGSCYPNPDRAPYTCDYGRIEYFSCESCCGTCEGEDCGNGACSPYPSCWQSHLRTKSIGPECLCG